jgi:hypothetical protein
MVFRLDAPTIPLDQIQWDEIGEDGDPKQRLLAHVRIGSLDMHLEAREIDTDGDGYQTTKCYSDDHDTLCNMSDVPSFQTLMINEREYFLFALPFGD